MSKMAQREAERSDALTKLRELFPVGSTVYLVKRKQTEASCQWSILAADGAEIENVSRLVSLAGIFPPARSRDYFAVTVRGTSNPYHVAYTLSQLLHGGTVAILGTVVL